MNIAIALNKKVIVQAYVLLASIAVNVKEKVTLYVLHSNLEKEDIDALRQALKINTAIGHEVVELHIDESIFIGFPYNSLWSLEMYYRLLLPDMLGDRIDRILYLDIDMIVNKDITEFYNLDFDDKEMIVAKDMEFDNLIMNNDEGEQKRNDLFIRLKDDGMIYFCSGMLLMNIKKLKDKYTCELYKDIFMDIEDSVVLPDQDLLNYIHYKNVKYVDEYKYGIFAQTAHSQGLTYDNIKQNAYIIHFTGQAKPWTVNLVRYDIEKIWWEYARLCPFYYELMESVFTKSMESRLVESMFDQLINENNELRSILSRCNDIMKKMK